MLIAYMSEMTKFQEFSLLYNINISVIVQYLPDVNITAFIL